MNANNSIELGYDKGVTAPKSSENYSRWMKKSKSQSSIVTLNVGGSRFETFLYTLERFPETLLGNERKRKKYWNEERKEYFFDRHRACFESILYYYQSNGQLRRPTDVPLDTFLDEICFFKLGPTAYDQVKEAEHLKTPKTRPMSKPHWRKVLWCHLEYPYYSVLAYIINIIALILTVISCIVLALSTLPSVEDNLVNECLEEENLPLNSTMVPTCSALFRSPLFIIQTICIAYFTIEFFLRCISTPSLIRFFTSFFTWIDLLAIVPYYVSLGLTVNKGYLYRNGSASTASIVLILLRLARILKLYIVFIQWKALRALLLAMKRSFLNFLGLICAIFICAFLFGSAAYCAENKNNGEVFDSIPKSTYWGIITITTVGYGDMYPITTIGRIIACLCAICGATFVGMLASVMVEQYQEAYKEIKNASEKEAASTRLKRMLYECGNEKENEAIGLERLSQEQNGKSVRRIWTMNHQIGSSRKKSLASSERSDISFSVSLDDGAIDNLLAGQIIMGFGEKILEMQKAMKKRFYLRIEDEDKKYLEHCPNCETEKY